MFVNNIELVETMKDEKNNNNNNIALNFSIMYLKFFVHFHYFFLMRKTTCMSVKIWRTIVSSLGCLMGLVNLTQLKRLNIYLRMASFIS